MNVYNQINSIKIFILVFLYHEILIYNLMMTWSFLQLIIFITFFKNNTYAQFNSMIHRFWKVYEQNIYQNIVAAIKWFKQKKN